MRVVFLATFVYGLDHCVYATLDASEPQKLQAKTSLRPCIFFVCVC